MQPAPPSFKIQCRGRWLPQQVRAQYHAARYELPPPHDARARAHWHMLLARNAQHLFNGELFRLQHFAASTAELTLVLGHTCYRDQIYCNAHTAELVATHSAAVLARGLGVSAVVLTSDGFLPLMRRGERVGEEPGKLDVFGGHAHPNQHLREGVPDLFRAIADEIIAELNVVENELRETYCCGVVENLRTHKPDLVFEIHLHKSRAAIMRDAAHAAEAEEVAELLFCPCAEAALRDFLVAHSTELTPSALGTLTLFATTLSQQALAD